MSITDAVYMQTAHFVSISLGLEFGVSLMNESSRHKAKRQPVISLGGKPVVENVVCVAAHRTIIAYEKNVNKVVGASFSHAELLTPTI